LYTNVFIYLYLFQLEEKVQVWQSSPASSLNPWFSFATCWSELVLPALQFLAGEAKGRPVLLTSVPSLPSLANPYNHYTFHPLLHTFNGDLNVYFFQTLGLKPALQ